MAQKVSCITSSLFDKLVILKSYPKFTKFFGVMIHTIENHVLIPVISNAFSRMKIKIHYSISLPLTCHLGLEEYKTEVSILIVLKSYAPGSFAKCAPTVWNILVITCACLIFLFPIACHKLPGEETMPRQKKNLKNIHLNLVIKQEGWQCDLQSLMSINKGYPKSLSAMTLTKGLYTVFYMCVSIYAKCTNLFILSLQ